MLISSAGYCKLLLTGRRVMCVSAAACSGSVQVLSVDPVSHFHTVRYKFVMNPNFGKEVCTENYAETRKTGKPLA